MRLVVYLAVMKKEEDTYVIRNGDQFVAVDAASGGYPYDTDRLDLARLWYGKTQAEKYIKVCQYGGRHSNWKLVRVVALSS